MSQVGSTQEKALAKAIAKARKGAGFTQQELCNKAGLSYSTLAKIERGAIKTPSVFTVATIASVTGTTVEALTGISGNALPQSSAAPVAPTKQYKTSKNGVKFIYFDINGVLVRFFQRAFTQMSSDTGASADGVEATFWHYNDVLCKGDMSLEEFNSILAKRIGVQQIDWADYYMNNVDPITEMRECIAWAAEHYKVGLMSNIMPGFIKRMLKDGLLPNIDYAAIIDSSEVGAIKPEPEIYEAAKNLSGANNNEILLIDDSRPNLMAAERLGWHVLWFDDYRPDEGAKRVKDTLAY
jgi:FMN phosphatase YigB (HAD superfamily)/DNA-binding XRE family transcriptional regulator